MRPNISGIRRYLQIEYSLAQKKPTTLSCSGLMNSMLGVDDSAAFSDEYVPIEVFEGVLNATAIDLTDSPFVDRHFVLV